MAARLPQRSLTCLTAPAALHGEAHRPAATETVSNLRKQLVGVGNHGTPGPPPNVGSSSPPNFGRGRLTDREGADPGTEPTNHRPNRRATASPPTASRWRLASLGPLRPAGAEHRAALRADPTPSDKADATGPPDCEDRLSLGSPPSL